MTGAAAPLFRGPADRRWWQVKLGDETVSWSMDVRVDEITGVRFVREPYQSVVVRQACLQGSWTMAWASRIQGRWCYQIRLEDKLVSWPS